MDRVELSPWSELQAELEAGQSALSCDKCVCRGSEPGKRHMTQKPTCTVPAEGYSERGDII